METPTPAPETAPTAAAPQVVAQVAPIAAIPAAPLVSPIVAPQAAPEAHPVHVEAPRGAKASVLEVVGGWRERWKALLGRVPRRRWQMIAVAYAVIFCFNYARTGYAVETPVYTNMEFNDNGFGGGVAIRCLFTFRTIKHSSSLTLWGSRRYYAFVGPDVFRYDRSDRSWKQIH